MCVCVVVVCVPMCVIYSGHLRACVGESVFLCLLMRRDRICPVFSVRATRYNAAEEPQQGVLGNEVVDMAMIRPSLSYDLVIWGKAGSARDLTSVSQIQPK